jgi:hypothetical protein
MSAARLNYHLLLVVSAVVCLVAPKATWGIGNTPSALTASCREIRIDFDDGTMPNAAKNYQKAVAQVLMENRFDDLDCLADDIRQNKTRFASGVWKLRALYWGISEPQGHATPEDWTEFLNRLNHWVTTKPSSITARVALAKAYAAYAWIARGQDSVDSVTANGWKQFAERTSTARQVLDDASKLSTKCPEWYFAMQQVSMAQQWEKAQATKLLQEAVAFEPTYYAYYRRHADYLQPMWFGEEGEAAKFAAQSADHLSGEQGDILYFEMASNICHCDEEPLVEQMSWSRIQKGFAALEKENGPSVSNLNVLAYMAVKVADPAIADEAFKRIGERRDEDIFQGQGYFDASKMWAAQVAPSFRWHQQVVDLAALAMRTPEGRNYNEAFEKQFAGPLQQCVRAAPVDLGKFEILVSIDQVGVINYLQSPDAVIECLHPFYGKVVAVPPVSPYWIKIDVDSTLPTSASAN